MILFTAVLCGFLLDYLFGDPNWIPHPVTYIGKYIAWLEPRLRARFPADQKGERRAGRRLVFYVILTVGGGSAAILTAAWFIHPMLFFALQTLWCWQCLAYRGLKSAAEQVRYCLEAGDLPGARTSLRALVGRDVEQLNRSGAICATVESVAENTNDGILAPLLYMLIGGAPLALTYKAINTMDSMVGYQNEKYIDFGRAAAKTDDAAGWLPARLGQLLLRQGACLSRGTSGKGAKRIHRRDAKKTQSPNAGQMESVAAGALGIRLGGPASYGGVVFDKPYLGDRTRCPETGDIVLAEKMSAKATYLLLIFGLLIRMIAMIFISSL